MAKTIVFFFYLLRTSIRSSISLRAAFLIELSLMISNNLIFLSLWWVFFREFKNVGGWQFSDMVSLMTVVTGGYGLHKICFGGVKEIARTISSGNLDSFMTQPKNLLLHLLGIKSRSDGWGGLMTALILFSLSNSFSWLDLPLIILLIVSICLIFTASSVIANSLAFWMGAIEPISKKYSDSLFLFAHYPVNIYSGFFQILMFTVFPAGMIGYVPVELLKNFSWEYFVGLLCFVALFSILAFFIFYKGLKRYESGSQFGIRF